MKALVLCAGFGTRLGSRTRTTPKPLLPIAGVPLLSYTLGHLAACGYVDVVVNVHYLGEQIRGHVGTGEQFGVRVSYSDEERLLGSAGSTRRVAAFFAGEPDFLVVHGDVLTDQDLLAMRRAHLGAGAPATILLDRIEGANSQVAMASDRRITGFIERPSPEQRRVSGFPWVNAGVYMMHHRFLAEIPDRLPCDFASDIFARAPAVEVYGFPLTGYRCAVDSEAEYQEANAAIRERRCVPWVPAATLRGRP
jgi:NDP-sugar pyrophosphorylase family protein